MPLAPLVQEIEAAGGKARPFGCDARDEEQMVALFDTIENEVGPVDVVVGGGYEWCDSDSHHGNDSHMSEPQQFQAHAMPCLEEDMPVSVYVPFCVSFNATKHGYVGSSLQLS